MEGSVRDRLLELRGILDDEERREVEELIGDLGEKETHRARAGISAVRRFRSELARLFDEIEWS